MKGSKTTQKVANDVEAHSPRRRGRPNIHEDVPVSLAPLDFETALVGLLQVKPSPKDEPTPKKQTANKRTTKKAARK